MCCVVADIGNSYLTACKNEKMYIIICQEFVIYYEGKCLLVENIFIVQEVTEQD